MIKLNSYYYKVDKMKISKGSVMSETIPSLPFSTTPQAYVCFISVDLSAYYDTPLWWTGRPTRIAVFFIKIMIFLLDVFAGLERKAEVLLQSNLALSGYLAQLSKQNWQSFLYPSSTPGFWFGRFQL